MKSLENRLKEVWRNHPPSLDDENMTPISQKEIYEMMGSIFCPGPFYFLVFDFITQDFKYVNGKIQEVLGLDSNNINIKSFTQRIKKEDRPHLEACEQLAGKFYFSYLPPEDISRYKTSYCFRIQKADGTYTQLLHQSFVLKKDEKGNILNTLVVHSTIDHLSAFHNTKISFMSLDKGKHYMGIDPYAKQISDSGNPTPLSKRETEVLRLLAEGYDDKKLGNMLNIAEGTVHKHRQNIRIKLSCNNTTQAVAMAIKSGWI